MIHLVIGFVLPAVVFAVIGALICLRKTNNEKKSQYVSLDSPTYYSVNVCEAHRIQQQHLPRAANKPSHHHQDAYNYQVPPVTCCHPETKLSPPPCYAEINSGGQLPTSKSAGCIPNAPVDAMGGWHQRYVPPPVASTTKLPYENASYHLDAHRWYPSAYLQHM